MHNQTLNPQKIAETAELLKRRVESRFPDRHLNQVCSELTRIALQAGERAIWLAKPIWWFRILVVLFASTLITLLCLSLPKISVSTGQMTVIDLVQGLESAINDVIFLCAGLFFLFTWEKRIKRERALKALHELRSLSHIVDMYQLTKDPDRVAEPGIGLEEKEPALTPFALARYLDYCTEMLAIIGKVAAVYAERLDDPVVLGAVNEIESLTNGLSRNIWQKIMVIYTAMEPRAA